MGRKTLLVLLVLILVVATPSSALGKVLAAGNSIPRSLQPVAVPDGLSISKLKRPATAVNNGPVEVILELTGNSLVQEQDSRRAAALPGMDRGEEHAFVQGLREQQKGTKGILEALDGHVTHTFQASFNGVSAIVEPSRLAEIAAVPGVKAVHRARIISPNLDNSVQFILGGKTNAELGLDGSGVTIAVIDTGIDYTHAAFGGSGNPADYAGNNPTVIEPGTFPTARVIAGTDMVGEFYDAACQTPGPPPGCTNTPQPDPDPLDIEGHGSHVAGIAAGQKAGDVSQGVAPAARLLAIKVFGQGPTSSANIVAAIELALDPDQDGDTSDHVDVINMSLGSPFGQATDPDAVAANAAAELGVIVVASAGNSGNLPFVTGSPAIGEHVIAVAAGNDPGIEVQLLAVGGSTTADGSYESMETSFTPPLSSVGTVTGPAAFVGVACDVGGPGGPNPFATGSLAGKVPLIQRGQCRFDEKVKNVEEAGATAGVIFNNVPGGGPFAGGGDPIVNIPAVVIGNSDGVTLRDSLTSGTTFTLDPANQLPVQDRLQDFTSRGPRFTDLMMKPDITAPGGSVLSVAAGTGTGAVSLSGTSMSSPHVAGAAALLRQLHPDWTVEEIKSLMMNTATNASLRSETYALSLMGAGRVRVDVAAKTGAVVTPGSISFGVSEVVTGVSRTFARQLTVENKSAGTKTFNLSSSFLSTGTDNSGITLQHPSSLRVPAGASTNFDLKTTVDFEVLAAQAGPGGHDGFLTLTEASPGGDVLRVPFQIVPIVRAAATATGQKDLLAVENRGSSDTAVDIYQLGVSDANESLLVRAPGQPRTPDDWFDIRFTGAHTFNLPPFGHIVEFGVAVHGNRSTPSPMVTEVFVDVDKDGNPDYDVLAADLGLLTTGSFTGQMVSAIFDVASGDGLTQFNVADDKNVSWQTIPFRVSALNALGTASGSPTLSSANHDFQYWVVTTDQLSESLDFDITDKASFDAFVPQVDATPNFITLAPGDEQTISVAGSGRLGTLLVLFYNNASGRPESDSVTVALEGAR